MTETAVASLGPVYLTGRYEVKWVGKDWEKVNKTVAINTKAL